MGKTLAYKILENHLVEGNLTPGEEITIKIDQTLTQDSTGTMVYLQLEAMDIDKVQTELSVAYIDHNTLQTWICSPCSNPESSILTSPCSTFIFAIWSSSFFTSPVKILDSPIKLATNLVFGWL